MKVYCSECEYLTVSGIEICNCKHKDNIEYLDLHQWYSRGNKKVEHYNTSPANRNRHNDCVLYKARKE